MMLLLLTVLPKQAAFGQCLHRNELPAAFHDGLVNHPESAAPEDVTDCKKRVVTAVGHVLAPKLSIWGKQLDRRGCVFETALALLVAAL